MQRLLAVLAAGRRCAETGTALGEGATAIASTATSLVTVESDPERAEIARVRLASLPNVDLLVGDWRQLLPPHAPFDFLFFDAGHIDQTSRPNGPPTRERVRPEGSDPCFCLSPRLSL